MFTQTQICPPHFTYMPCRAYLSGTYMGMYIHIELHMNTVHILYKLHFTLSACITEQIQPLHGTYKSHCPCSLLMYKFPNCLCSISTRQLELLLWRAGPAAQHIQDCPIFFIQLNYVHNQYKVLPPYVKLPCHKVASRILLPLN